MARPIPASPQLEPIHSADLTIVGKYCVILYDNRPYPGRILSVDETDIEVLCMHSSATKYDSNIFYWPERTPDKCFYSFENIITLIPEPVKVADHGRLSSSYKVDPSLWKLVEQYCTK